LKKIHLKHNPPSIPPLPGEGSSSSSLSPGRGKMSEGQIGVF